MNLRYRPGGKRLGIKGCKDIFRGAAKVRLQLLAQLPEGDRRRTILELFEFGDPFRREQINTRGQDLSQFDEGGSEFLEGLAYPGRRLEADDLLDMVPMKRMPGPFKGTGHADAADRVTKSITNEDRGNVMHATQITGGAERLPKHERLSLVGRGPAGGIPCCPTAAGLFAAGSLFDHFGDAREESRGGTRQ